MYICVVVRLVSPTQSVAGVSDAASTYSYELSRMSHGVPNGGSDMVWGSSLPLEYSMDWLNAISYTKGCYLGQELTTRTHFTGQIRKRLVPTLIVPRPTTQSQADAAVYRELSTASLKSYDSGLLWLPPAAELLRSATLKRLLAAAPTTASAELVQTLDPEAPIALDTVSPQTAATTAPLASGRAAAGAVPKLTSSLAHTSSAVGVGLAMLRTDLLAKVYPPPPPPPSSTEAGAAAGGAATGTSGSGSGGASSDSYLRCGDAMLIPFAPAYFQ